MVPQKLAIFGKRGRFRAKSHFKKLLEIVALPPDFSYLEKKRNALSVDLVVLLQSKQMKVQNLRKHMVYKHINLSKSLQNLSLNLPKSPGNH